MIIVDDVVTTAGSTIKAIEAAEAEGHTVVAVICLVDREEGGAAKLADVPVLPVVPAERDLRVGKGTLPFSQ